MMNDLRYMKFQIEIDLWWLAPGEIRELFGRPLVGIKKKAAVVEGGQYMSVRNDDILLYICTLFVGFKGSDTFWLRPVSVKCLK